MAKSMTSFETTTLTPHYQLNKGGIKTTIHKMAKGSRLSVCGWNYPHIFNPLKGHQENVSIKKTHTIFEDNGIATDRFELCEKCFNEKTMAEFRHKIVYRPKFPSQLDRVSLDV